MTSQAEPVGHGRRTADAVTADDRSDGSLEWEVQLELQLAPYRGVRNVSCLQRGGVLILEGRVPTFYQKQLAQQIALRLVAEGMHVDNQVRVVEQRPATPLRSRASKWRPR